MRLTPAIERIDSNAGAAEFGHRARPPSGVMPEWDTDPRQFSRGPPAVSGRPFSFTSR